MAALLPLLLKAKASTPLDPRRVATCIAVAGQVWEGCSLLLIYPATPLPPLSNYASRIDALPCRSWTSLRSWQRCPPSVRSWATSTALMVS